MEDMKWKWKWKQRSTPLEGWPKGYPTLKMSGEADP